MRALFRKVVDFAVCGVAQDETLLRVEHRHANGQIP